MNGKSFTQAMVNQTPKYDNAVRRKAASKYQVIGRTSKIIRPDKRRKVKYL